MADAEFERLLNPLLEPGIGSGYGSTCYGCQFASVPLRRDGTLAPWSEVSNDPTEAYFRCSLPSRCGVLEWGEYAPCSAKDWASALTAYHERALAERDARIAELEKKP